MANELSPTAEALLRELSVALGELHSLDGKLTKTIQVISQFSAKYHWVGIYQVEDNRQWLSLFPHFIGKATEHTRIPVTSGICGAAVREGRTLVVDDVKSDPRYLACSLETQSEIVVPIYKGQTIVAEIDIDSDQKAAFTSVDRAFLESVAKVIGPHLHFLGSGQALSL